MTTVSRSPAPYELLDDGFAPARCEVLVVGCGNILRGDDAVGPVLVRELMARGLPDGVRVVDGGTAGMDVAFGMRGASRVVIVDAATTGASAGTIYRVPADALAELPPLEGVHTHNFRWDHALAFADWLLGPEKPTDITVFLVEADEMEPGAALTEKVAAAMEQVIELLQQDFWPKNGWDVEVTSDGYLHLPAELAANYFASDTTLIAFDGHELRLMPLRSAANGGWVLKQRNSAGDRSLLVNEALGFAPIAGRFQARWDEQRGALLIQTLSVEVGDGPGVRRDDVGQLRVGQMGGLAGSHEPERGGDQAPLGLANGVRRSTTGGRGAQDSVSPQDDPKGNR